MFPALRALPDSEDRFFSQWGGDQEHSDRFAHFDRQRESNGCVLILKTLSGHISSNPMSRKAEHSLGIGVIVVVFDGSRFPVILSGSDVREYLPFVGAVVAGSARSMARLNRAEHTFGVSVQDVQGRASTEAWWIHSNIVC